LEGIPQGLKPLFYKRLIEKPKAEALGYLEAKTRTEATTTATAKTKYRDSSLCSE
jgi:hypothetical protein